MDKQSLFSSSEMMSWIHDMAAFGPRRAGSPGGLANEDYLVNKLKNMGLENVRKEAMVAEHYAPFKTTLEIETEEGFKTFNSQWIPYCTFTSPEGLEADLVYANSRSLTHLDDWKGKIIVTEIEFPELNLAMISKLAMGKYDPDNSLKDINHPATFVRLGWHLYRKAFERGAVGFIGILKDQPGGSYQMFAPYGFKEKNILDKPIPGLWVSREDGPLIKSLAKKNAKAHILHVGERKPSVTHNVIGEIPGETDEAIILHCHHDSPFMSPVEDASGCAVILALAKYFKQQKQPRRKIIILFTAGHFYGSIGTRTFIHEHREDIVPKVALEITVEHVAKEAVENPEKNGLIESGLPEGMGVFLPYNNAMVDAVLTNLRSNQLDRAFLLPPEGPFGHYPPTDGGDWYEAGVPLINFISNPVYLLNAEDDFHWVAEDRLPKMAGAVAGIVEASEKLTKAQMGAVDFKVMKMGMRVLKHLVMMKTTKCGLRPIF